MSSQTCGLARSSLPVSFGLILAVLASSAAVSRRSAYRSMSPGVEMPVQVLPHGCESTSLFSKSSGRMNVEISEVGAHSSFALRLRRSFFGDMSGGS